MATKNDFSEIQRKNMEAAMRLAQLSIDNSQRIMELQSRLARELFENSVEQAKAQTASTSPQDIVALRSRYAQETTQKMVAAAQQVAEIGNSARTEFSRLLTEQLAAGSQDLVDAFQSFFKALPGQNASVLETMQQAMANANTAYEQMGRAAKAAFESAGDAAKKAPAAKAKK
ncbi:MAG: phasin family protein [Gammaproteobacteria bacterium]|nr:phasin family protein [Gammaproteobacteria bacterium]MBU1414241.1 phasin family protein [Gammaproteobacteria bacterium]